MQEKLDEGRVWIAAYRDWSGVTVFPSELRALRFANTHGGMVVADIAYGEVVGPGWDPVGGFEQLKEQFRNTRLL